MYAYYRNFRKVKLSKKRKLKSLKHIGDIFYPNRESLNILLPHHFQ